MLIPPPLPQIPVLELCPGLAKIITKCPSTEMLFAFSHRRSCLIGTEILHETAQKVCPEAVVLQTQSAVVLLLQMIYTLVTEQKLRIPLMWILTTVTELMKRCEEKQ